jgi:3-hydroxyacyl-CoA dehydrogenase/enoyl-CoA hydratase/3-hydroxybutyryl-CoA epimerase/enoyl-CoA isomerase
MIFQSDTLAVRRLDSGIAELTFDLQGESVNKFNQATMQDLAAALEALHGEAGIKGLLVSSAKPVFIVGADITEFSGVFGEGPERIKGFARSGNETFNRLEELPFPTVVAINGYALGGGFELCLACDFRVMSHAAKIGLPETKLGIVPGWGGTVRLPRLIGIDEALLWIASARDQKADAALRVGAVDALASPEQLRAVAEVTLQRAIDGSLDYAVRRKAKQSPIPINSTEAMMAFFTGKALIGQQAGKNYPAPVAAATAIEKGATMGRDGAQQVEAEVFAELASGEVARSLVGVFLADQLLAKKARAWSKKADAPVTRAAVLGAGIMGGGIAYQSAYSGVPIKMKDIAQAGLDLGLGEANKLLSKRVERGRMKPAKMGEVLNHIEPTLSYDGFDQVDYVIEAVVENVGLKQAVLAEAEQHVGENTVLASNTSTISINTLAEGLQRPDKFCGMHFFNPVHAMPLVEVIRGDKTSDATIGRAVAYATTMGKKAVVVRDCPGFLVNRVLFPYFDGFSRLVREGADYQAIDKVMERWGWPMGPAYLLDVVGIDTAVHAGKVMADAFPDRMSLDFPSAAELMLDAGRLGQKNGMGLYDYVPDKKGKPKKTPSDTALQLLAGHVGERREFSEEEIVARLMVPLATELARCLEEGVVETPQEADLALLFGLGFPPFRGGVFRWMDAIGMPQFAAMAAANEACGPLYTLTEGMAAKLANNETWYD